MALTSLQLKTFHKDSLMREGILNWYPFTSESSVLEQSNGCLTALLRLRCKTVMPLVGGYSGKENVDYVVVMDPGEITLDLLKLYKSYLNPHGRLLMIFENPFGLQYFSGKFNSRTKAPFSFLKGESKAEVEGRLKQVGFLGQKWYYPFTNHYFAREVYSEKYLPNELLNHRSTFFMEDDYTKEFDERGLWKEVIRNGAFEFMCCSYLVEARVSSEDQECSVDYAAITAYRNNDKAFVTTLHNNGIAKKSALFSSGISRLSRMCEIHGELVKLGIKVIPVTLINDSLIMERLDYPTLWDYLGKKLINGTLEEQKVFALFDRIREAIVKSSKNGTCYWELVPANCFYDEVQDELIFFDQEYCWKNTDCSFALVRTLYSLKYSYHFNNDKRAKLWLDKLIKRYDLKEKWTELSERADEETRSYIFNEQQNIPINREVKNAANRIAERKAEHIAAQLRYEKMSVVLKQLLIANIKHPAIYGYGRNGKILRYILESGGIEIPCIIDRKSPPVKGIPLYSSIAHINGEHKIDAIIVTPENGTEQIVNDLKNNTNYPILSLKELENE